MLSLKPIQDKGTTGNGRGLAFSYLGKFFAKASNNHVEIWRLPDYGFLRKVGGIGYVRDLSFSPDGSKLVSSHNSGAFVWNMVTFEREHDLLTDAGKIAYDPQGKWFATIEWGWNKNGRDILLWEPNTGEEVRSFYRQNKFVSCIMFSPDGRILAIGDKAGLVTLLETNTGHLMAELTGQSTEISCVSFNPDGSAIAIGAINGQIKIKTLNNNAVVPGFYLHEQKIVDICWFNGGRQLVSTSEDGVMFIWNESDGYSHKRIQYRDKISHLAWNHEHQQVAISGSTVKIFAYTIAPPTIGEIAEPATKIQAETPASQSQRNETSSPAASTPEFRQIQTDFAGLMKSSDPHSRGILLEGLLDRIFKFYQIDSIESFRRNGGGEQIDGGFRLEGWHYLIECKWRKQVTDTQELDGLVGKVSRSGKQTMGFFLSINGWSEHVPNLLRQNPDKSIILMNGVDLRLVIDHQIDLRAVILEKIAQLNFAGEPYYSVEQYLQGVKAKDK